MYKQIYKFSAVLLIGFYLSGCQAITGETLGQNIDDTTITTTVKSKLAVDKASSLTRVGVDTIRGTVHLTGVVDSQATKNKAAEIAQSVDGVKNVVNNLQVQSK
ncbi:MAG TPA: BON domain-containing protein [Candidatus Nitrosocosmicus sp.]|jgi:osmotically-inducible protein OsmY|nr:BON domain-containing protein [Candidatus Nitrosocosmicus sp.]